MSNSDYTTIGKMPDNNISQNNNQDKESYAEYYLYVKKYPVLLVILSLLALIISIVAISYALFTPIESKNVISGVFIFGSIALLSLCYLIDVYNEYKSWSIFGEQVNNTNVKAWEGEETEYPELKRPRYFLWKIVFPSCTLLAIGGVLLFFFATPPEENKDVSPGETETTTVIVPGEDTKDAPVNPGVQNNNNPVITENNSPININPSIVQPNTGVNENTARDDLRKDNTVTTEDQTLLETESQKSPNENTISSTRNHESSGENNKEESPNTMKDDMQYENNDPQDVPTQVNTPSYENSSPQPQNNSGNSGSGNNVADPAAPVINTNSIDKGENE